MSYAGLCRLSSQWAICVGLATGVALGALPRAAVADEPAGKATAVNRNAEGTPPTQPTRVLTVGIDVFQRERVRTDSVGQAQLLFLDGSTITIGPNSDLVLDDFVYDPASGTGKIAATVTAGLFRFIGGRISKESPVTIKTPAGEAAVRGAVMLLSVEPGTGATSATLLYGRELRLTGTKGGTAVITRPGFTSSIAGAGALPSPATRLTAQTLQQMSKLEGRAGASGGAPTRPTEGAVASAPLGSTLTTQSAAANLQSSAQQAAVSARQQIPSQSTNTVVAQTTSENATTQLAPQVLTDPALTGDVKLLPGPPSFLAFNIQNDPALQSNIPFVINQNVATSGAVVSPMLMVLPTGSFVTSGVPAAMQVSLDIEGTGANQHSGVSLLLGNVTKQSSPTTFTRPLYFEGVFTGTNRFASNFDPTLVGSGVTSNNTASGGSPFSATSAESFTISPDVTSFGTTTTGTAFAAQKNPSAPEGVNTINYTFTNTAIPTSLPAGIGVQRTTQTLSGYAAAFVNVGVNNVPNFTRLDNYLATTADTPTGVQISTNAASGRVQGEIDLAQFANFLNPNNTASLQLRYGTLTGNYNYAQTFIDNSDFAARAAFQSAPNTPNVQLTTVNGTTATSTSGMYLFTGTTVPPTSILPPGVSFCSCQFVQWGFFGGEVESGPNNREDLINLGTWVAGPLADPSLIPQSGSATYVGHAIGTVVEGPPGLYFTAAYVAAGGFQATYNFASRSGTVQINNFDGANYSGTVNSANFRDFTGALTSSVAGRSGALAASFFGTTDPTAEVGGKFTVSSLNATYSAAGIVAGRKQ
jgi:hypothetical protein